MGDVRLDLEQKTQDYIRWLASFGETEEGGITRLLYSKEWQEAQDALKTRLDNSGFEVGFDEVGNLFGRLKATSYDDETILVGSHIDTVVNGGRLDGQFGIIGGAIALEYLKEKYGYPLRNLELVSIAEEEGSRFPFTFWGAKNIVGKVDREAVKELIDEEGISFVEAMHEAGFDFKTSEPRKDIRAFIELHIEQGGVLEREGKSIGIVEHIVGQGRYLITVEGEANHAGTTPMGYRKDAIHGTSKMISEIMDMAVSYGDPLVATVGRMEIFPNTSNVVAGKVIFSLDIRHTDKNIMEKFTGELLSRIRAIGATMELNVDVESYMDEDPVAMSPGIVKLIKEECDNKGLAYKMMHSGAGHDSQIFAEHVPTGMIFVPSHKGISHNPAEFTEIKDLVEGIKALIETLYILAYK